MPEKPDSADAGAKVAPATTWQSRYDALLGQTNAAVDQLRTVVKWLAASLGAVAALLLAGVQLTSIGEVPFTHAVIAAGAALVTLSAAGAAIFQLVNVLIPAITTRQDVVEAAGEGEFKTFVTKHAYLLAGHSSIESLAEAQRTAAETAQKAGATPKQKQEWQRLTEALNLLVPFGSYFAVRRAYSKARKWTMGAAGIASIGIVTFAWQTGQTDSATASAAVAPQPVAGYLQLNEQGVEQFVSLLQPGCARQLAKRQTSSATRASANAIAIETTDDSWSVILIPRGSCQAAEAFTLEATSGRFVVPLTSPTG